VVSNALLIRKLDFKRLAVVDAVSYSVGFGVVGISLAFYGLGVWALAFSTLVQKACRAALLYRAARHPLVLKIRNPELAQLMSFGMGLSLTRVFNQLASRGDYFIVGRWLGPESLAFYERAYRLVDMLAVKLAGVLTKVAFPGLSRIQDDTGALRRVFLQGSAFLAMLYFPIAVFLIFSGSGLVVLLFGSQWADVGAPFQVLSLGLPFRSLSKFSEALTRAKGAVYGSAWRAFVYALAVVLGALGGVMWGIIGVAGGVLLAGLIRYVIISQLCLKLLRLPVRKLAIRLVPALLLGLVQATGLMLLESFFSTRDVTLLGLLTGQLAMCFFTVGLLYLCFPGSWLWRDTLQLIQMLRKTLVERSLGSPEGNSNSLTVQQ
jgi:PST family polysaccharide transporter